MRPEAPARNAPESCCSCGSDLCAWCVPDVGGSPHPSVDAGIVDAPSLLEAATVRDAVRDDVSPIEVRARGGRSHWPAVVPSSLHSGARDANPLSAPLTRLRFGDDEAHADATERTPAPHARGAQHEGETDARS